MGVSFRPQFVIGELPMQLTGSARLSVGAQPATPLSGNAVAISELVINEDRLTTAIVFHLMTFIMKTQHCQEELTCDIPNASPKALENLDEIGIVRVGSYVKRGDILVGKIAPKSDSALTPEEKVLQGIFGRTGEEVRDESLYYENQDPGQVVCVYLKALKTYQTSKVAQRPGVVFVDYLDWWDNTLMVVSVEVMVRRTLTIGDILEDDQGNKVVLARIGLPPQEPVLALGY
jgi:DNA-directed RNA polymerase subunit beta